MVLRLQSYVFSLKSSVLRLKSYVSSLRAEGPGIGV